MRIVRRSDLDWAAFVIPDATPPVRLARLHEYDSRALSVLVEFPPGWTRPGRGHYPVAEEVLFLRGSFTMSGHRYRAGDYAWFPPGYDRVATSAPEGALALGWFGGPTRWSRHPAPAAGTAKTAVTADASRGCRWEDLPVEDSPVGPGRRLPAGGAGSSWVVDTVPAGTVMPLPDGTVEVFSLAETAWALVEPGQPLPEMAGPAFVRITVAGRP